MSWAEVKKINSDLSKPLNDLVDEKTNSIEKLIEESSTKYIEIGNQRYQIVPKVEWKKVGSSEHSDTSVPKFANTNSFSEEYNGKIQIRFSDGTYLDLNKNIDLFYFANNNSAICSNSLSATDRVVNIYIFTGTSYDKIDINVIGSNDDTHGHRIRPLNNRYLIYLEYSGYYITLYDFLTKSKKQYSTRESTFTPHL